MVTCSWGSMQEAAGNTVEISRKAPVNLLFNTFVGSASNCKSEESVKFRKLKLCSLKSELSFKKMLGSLVKHY